MDAVGRVDRRGLLGQGTAGKVQHRVGQAGIVLPALVLELPHVVGQGDAQGAGLGEVLAEILAMALHAGGERPGVHAVGADADRAAPPAGAEGQDLVEAVEQPGPLGRADEPFDLRAIGLELRLGQPLGEVAERGFPGGLRRGDGGESLSGPFQQAHAASLLDGGAVDGLTVPRRGPNGDPPCIPGPSPAHWKQPAVEAPAMLLLLLFAAGPLPRIDFARDVRPILAARCIACHGPAKQRGDLRLDSRASATKDGAVVPGHPARSGLIQRVLGDSERMPPSGPPLAPGQVAVLREWIRQGAPWPAQARPAASHWAYRPLARPKVPSLAGPLRSPIDAFLAARRGALKPAPPASRRVLLRRLSFDLAGLPPAFDDPFLADARPDAYERLVERLLASPALGEKQARHWLDVVHWAETHGHDQDVPRENAWPYRDWLIAAFNSDLPYPRFIRQQVAGDVLHPGDPGCVAATGLLAAGPWDESSLQSIRDDTLDKKQAQNLDRDDMLATVMSAFASTTVHCARCHDHKFDPVSQKEYYALQAVFAGIDRADRPLPDPRRLELASERARVLALDEKALLGVDVREWEKGRASWNLPPMTVATKHGSTARRLDDGSWLFEGPRPAVEVATVRAVLAAPARAVRVEVLAHPSLPKGGPGRQDNGNLHLNEFKADDGKPVRIVRALADFDQAGWGAAQAIDGKPATAWGIYPQVGKPHHAVFVLDRPIVGKVAFTLEQTHGGGHLIGRLRLTVSASPDASALPPAIEAILASAERTPAQRAALARHVLLSRLDAALAKLPPPRMAFAAASDFKPVGSFRPAKGCRPVRMLRRGDIAQPGALAAPAALSCIEGLPGSLRIADAADEGQRRAALARWLSDDRNALAWRSMANRAWQRHFGRGLAPSPSDLGKMGGAPTHPELLDWLACELRDSGGSLKHLHRLILGSDAYRRDSRHDPDAARADADNRLLWRFDRRRLEAEEVRDAMLAISGDLDRAMGGPSAKEFTSSKGIHVTPNADYAAFAAPTRRAVYRFHFRTLPDPFFDALDCPDASQFSPVRSASVTALQALALYNGPLAVRQSERLAARLKGDPDPLRTLWRLGLAREILPAEKGLMHAHMRKHGLAAACRVLLNASEFVFVD